MLRLVDDLFWHPVVRWRQDVCDCIDGTRNVRGNGGRGGQRDEGREVNIDKGRWHISVIWHVSCVLVSWSEVSV
jgi:hypothetical protein